LLNNNHNDIDIGFFVIIFLSKRNGFAAENAESGSRPSKPGVGAVSADPKLSIRNKGGRTMLTRWSDIEKMFGAMDLLRGRMDRMFTDYERFYPYGMGLAMVEGMPRTNLYDNGDNFTVVAEVPGLAKDDLNVKIQGNYLEISGTRKADVPEGYSVHRSERGTTGFSRSFTLPADVDGNKVDATLKNGILTLTLPKAEAAKAKQITIN